MLFSWEPGHRPRVLCNAICKSLSILLLALIHSTLVAKPSTTATQRVCSHNEANCQSEIWCFLSFHDQRHGPTVDHGWSQDRKGHL
ncbi:hypothetical protein BKA66DRAFT_455212 [Pyrenochaeta sp. MPI-SDFR-AT-0127]|nr:hypothetical protein BKA66DRAFT_455212 [Pyrenochaeta sp. MPI-SDFR-AT-0127]